MDNKTIWRDCNKNIYNESNVTVEAGTIIVAIQSEVDEATIEIALKVFE